ncbi:MAG: adenylyl cyclase, partial [Actinomycetia bacterium]|nr:adenylyl cyclase [Actinomycetes bacterium]
INVTPIKDDPGWPVGCNSGNEMWAVSQAAPMRRVQVNGSTTFMPWCQNPNYASGGYVADSILNGAVTMGSQQQFYMRNTSLIPKNGMNYVWNQVFSGTTNAPANDFGNGHAYTTLDTTPVSKERPYLFIDAAGTWSVFVPSMQTNSSGVSWANGPTPGASIPLSSFFVASPSDSAQTINAALARGLNLILTPGVYTYADSIDVKKANTVVLGLGFATLTAARGNAVLTTGDVVGIDIAGLTADAGPLNSPVLMQIGSKNPNNGKANNDPGNPVALQDVFFRIGGPHVGKATVALEVNTSNAILDHLWIWRADHGVPGSVGWDINTSDTGLVVNGNNVTATGLFVEHFQKYNVIWNGQGGTVIFFQNELPYDPPTQDAYQHDGVLGYAAFKVADSVKTFQGYGLGSYIYTPVNPGIVVSNAFEVPDTPGVQMTNLLTINLSGPGTITNVINNVGGQVDTNFRDIARQVVWYSNGVWR